MTRAVLLLSVRLSRSPSPTAPPATRSMSQPNLLLETGLEPKDQRLLFRGKEKEDEELLHMAGVKDRSKILLLEEPASKERKLEETRKSNEISQALEAVAAVRAEVDKISERVATLEVAVDGGTKVAEKEFLISTELLMKQLLKLDSIQAEGEAKLQRKAEVDVFKKKSYTCYYW